MRRLGAALSALALCAGLPAAANNGAEPLAWLHRAAEAARQQTYSGTVMHMLGDRTSTSRITHVVVAGIEHERIESLDGPRREVIREGDKLQCFFPDAKTVRIDRRVTARFFPSLVGGPVDAIAESYNLALGSIERVLGQDCQWIHLDPKDRLRYAQRLCAEVGTGLLLRAKILGGRQNERVLEQYTFTDLRVGRDVSRREVRGSFVLQSRGWRRDEQPASEPKAGETGWAVASPPPGFRLVGEMQRTLPHRPQPVTQLVLSDGLATVSVFIEPLEGVPQPAEAGNAPRRGTGEGTNQDGSLSVYVRPVGEHLVTVLGEVPPTAAQQVGRSVGRPAAR